MENSQVEEVPTAYEQIDSDLLSRILRQVDHVTPVYVYFQNYLESQAKTLIRNFKKNPSVDTTIRYAMKAQSNINILKIFDKQGLHFDCSSVYEAIRVIKAGIDPSKIDLVTQELTKRELDMLSEVEGSDQIHFIASSLHQLEVLRSHEKFKNQVEGIRINPGFGSGFHSKTCVAGPKYSFGIWHESLDQLSKDFKIRKIHSHIGAGSDPKFWLKSAEYLLSLIETKFLDVEILNLGGGFKIHRGEGDNPSTIQEISEQAIKLAEDFMARTKRNLKLEIEPGTFLVANSGVIISQVIDITSTHSSKDADHSEKSYDFLKLDTGLNDITRPALYGAQHDIRVIPDPTQKRSQSSIEHSTMKKYVVVGHCCESGDLLTCQRDFPDNVKEIEIPSDVQIGDYAVIKGTGAYCSAMSLKNYNSFPELAEVMVVDIPTGEKEIKIIRKRQLLDQIYQNEVLLSP